MRIVVMSDSHFNFPVLKEIVNIQKSADIFVYLGDGELDFQELMHHYPEKEMHCVRGNCDGGSLTPFAEMMTCCGKQIFLTHGHLFRVKFGVEELKEHAVGIGADILLYGHTHMPYTGYDDGLYIMNPGSVSLPKSGRPTYGVIDITEAGIVLNIVEL